jgi:hypothetical protein
VQSIRKITPPTFPAHVADRIAASYRPVPMSPADQAAHESASHLSPKGRAALERATSAVQRLEIEAAWDATSQGLAEYEAWVAA